jgi:hypothetical protein
MITHVGSIEGVEAHPGVPMVLEKLVERGYRFGHDNLLNLLMNIVFETGDDFF